MDSLFQLLVLALPVACVSWTVTHEEVFREARDWFKKVHHNHDLPWVVRKFAYMPTCEYCFSHYVALGVLGLCQASGHRAGAAGIVVWLLDWFTLVWVANIYMNLHFRLRLSIRAAGAWAKHQERMAHHE